MQTGVEVVPNAIERPRIAGLLEQRWQRRVVAIVAGAGFGKSTAIAQAVGARPTAGRSDHLVRLDPTCSAATELVRRIGGALGLDAPDAIALARDLAELDGDHCLVIDDLHEIDPDSAGADAMRSIASSLLPNVHLVVASRGAVPIPLARARAAGLVLDIGEDDLAYTSDELADVAAATGTRVEVFDDTGGWPALVSLTAIAGRRGALVAGHPDRALTAAGRVIGLDPYHETAHRIRVQALLGLGDGAAARQAADEAELRLSELGVGAEPTTVEVLDRARAS